MKIICILTYERTGSGWLSNAFDTPESISVHELYTDDPTLIVYKFYKILTKIYKVDIEIINLFLQAYDPNNFFVDPKTHSQIKQSMLDNINYNTNLFMSLKNICKINNYNFIFKIFPQHLKYINTAALIDHCDYFIFNYRENMINSYLSLQRAKETGIWYSGQNERLKDQKKIHWKETDYLDYVKELYNKIIILKKIYDIANKDKKITIKYEDIHDKNNENIDKINYLKQLISDIDIKLNNSHFFKKQNIDYDILNKDEFIKSLKKVPILLDEKIFFQQLY